MAVLGLIVMQFFIASSEGLATISATHTIESQLSRAMREVLTDIRQGTQWVTLTGACNALGVPYTTGLSTLCFFKPSLDANGDTIDPAPQGAAGVVVRDTVIYTFDAVNGRLWRITDAAPGTTRPEGTTLIASDLLNAYFVLRTRVTGPATIFSSVTCSLTGQRTERGRTYNKTLISQADLRNF